MRRRFGISFDVDGVDAHPLRPVQYGGVRLPQRVQQFICDFDNGLGAELKPFSFKVQLHPNLKKVIRANRKAKRAKAVK